MINQAQQLINYIESSEKKPNSWELNYLDSIKRRIEKGMHITSAQINTLSNIYMKVYGGANREARQYV